MIGVAEWRGRDFPVRERQSLLVRPSELLACSFARWYSRSRENLHVSWNAFDSWLFTMICMTTAMSFAPSSRADVRPHRSFDADTQQHCAVSREP
ncbi:hypothetical protein B2J89_19515 [Acidovorax sp. SRB_24]|nr:hypothetical protein [Acidovorax sp. SRB_24]